MARGLGRDPPKQAVTQPLKLRPIAKREIQDAYDWYEDRRFGLGEEFLDTVHRALDRVAQAPLQFPKIRGEVRRAVLRRFPYALLYLVEPGATVIIGCFHGRRDPHEWHDRR